MTIPQGRLRRTAPIAAVSARAAGGGVVDVLRRRLKGERGASLEYHVRNAERYADVLSRSKGVLMKVGQMVSFVDAGAVLEGPYGEVYRAALASLQADAEPMEPVLVAAVIESELGRPPEEVFAEFSLEPIAAASIGQVHAGRLHDGTEVAVKVQYPGVADAMRDDLANTELLFTFIKIVKGLVPQYRNFDVRALSDEIAERIGKSSTTASSWPTRWSSQSTTGAIPSPVCRRCFPNCPPHAWSPWRWSTAGGGPGSARSVRSCATGGAKRSTASSSGASLGSACSTPTLTPATTSSMTTAPSRSSTSDA
jgi:hypothetical protein